MLMVGTGPTFLCTDTRGMVSEYMRYCTVLTYYVLNLVVKTH